MAPKEIFPKEMADWFQSVYPEFDAKLGINKPQLPGQPGPTDDPDLRLWKKKKREEFEKKFADTLNQVNDWRVVSYPNSSFTPPLSIYLLFNSVSTANLSTASVISKTQMSNHPLQSQSSQFLFYMNRQQPQVGSFLSTRTPINSVRKPLNVVTLLGRLLSLMPATGNQLPQLRGRLYRMRRGRSGKKRLSLLI
jgi:hypothetical protein